MDVNEARNRVVVGYSDAGAIERVVQLVNDFNIPSHAVLYQVQTPSKTTSEDLIGVVRPVVGGLRILPDGSFNCTLAYNVLRAAAADTFRYGLTNSHCTGARDTVTYQYFYQPSGGFPLGTEWFDPPAVGPDCLGVPGYKCRYADVAAIRYDSNVASDFGYLARPVLRGGSSTVIDSINPRIPIYFSAGYPVYGTTVDKIGATTGWRHGPVHSTCVNYYQYAANRMLVCQYGVTMFMLGGDSGSPMFYYDTDGTPRANTVGIAWGFTIIEGDTVVYMSSSSGIATDFGELGVYWDIY